MFVFVFRPSFLPSLVVIVLEGEEHAVKFHYEELAKDNEAYQCRVDRVETQVAAASLCNPKALVSILHGKQKVCSFIHSFIRFF